MPMGDKVFIKGRGDAYGRQGIYNSSNNYN